LPISGAGAQDDPTGVIDVTGLAAQRVGVGFASLAAGAHGREHSAGTAGTLFRRADLGRCSARCPFNCDDFFEAFDTEGGEGRHSILTDAVNPKATVFGFHINVEVPEPFLVLAELFGDVLEGEDV
jgi:hypothetical protein